MDVDQEDTLGNVSEASLQNQETHTPRQSLAREGLNLIMAIPSSSGNEIIVKTNALIKCLERDIIAVDIKWSLFVAAAISYRVDSCLKPFPPQFTDGLEKNIDKLHDVISQVPSMNQLLEILKEYTYGHSFNVEVIDLLHWVLVEQDPKLIVATRDEYSDILELAVSHMRVNKPNFVLHVVSNWSEAAEKRWQEMATQYGTIHAYHGSKLENFHSILRHGLQQHLHKNGLFGSGIYLSSELGVSLPYSLNGCSWPLSKLGDQMSCVALCEAIDHPDVKCQQPGMSRSQARSRALSRDSIGGEVPDKYYLVCNSDLVRVRFLLIYSKISHRNNHPALSWLRKYKMFLLVAAYIVLLFGIGLSSSNSTRWMLRRFFHRLWY